MARDFKDVEARVWSRLPDSLRRPGVPAAWSMANVHRPVDSFLEGPDFDRDGNLLLVDIPFGRVLQISPAAVWSVVAETDGWPNGLKVEPAEVNVAPTALITDYRHGLVRVNLQTGARESVLAHRHSECFRGVNDLTDLHGTVRYFTDQGQSGLHDPAGRVYRWDGTRLDLLVDRIPSPNGIVLRPDGTQLYVAVTRANAIWRVPLQPDGGVSKVGLFIQMSGGTGPDGITMDAAGNLYVAHIGLGSVWVFDPRGEARARIRTPGDWPTNVALSPDGDTLFITEAQRGEVLVFDLGAVR